MTFSKCTFNDILKNVLTRGTPEYRARHDTRHGNHWSIFSDILTEST